MKKLATIIGLLSLMLVVTSFTTPNKIGGTKDPVPGYSINDIGGTKDPVPGFSTNSIGGTKDPVPGIY